MSSSLSKNEEAASHNASSDEDNEDLSSFGNLKDSCEIAKGKRSIVKDVGLGQSDAHSNRIVTPLDAAVLDIIGLHNASRYFELSKVANELLPLFCAQDDANQRVGTKASPSPFDAAIVDKIGTQNEEFFYEVKAAIADSHHLIYFHESEENSSDEDDEGEEGEKVTSDDEEDVALIKSKLITSDEEPELASSAIFRSVHAAATNEADDQGMLFDPKDCGVGVTHVLAASGTHVTSNESNVHLVPPKHSTDVGSVGPILFPLPKKQISAESHSTLVQRTAPQMPHHLLPSQANTKANGSFLVAERGALGNSVIGEVVFTHNTNQIETRQPIMADNYMPLSSAAYGNKFLAGPMVGTLSQLVPIEPCDHPKDKVEAAFTENDVTHSAAQSSRRPRHGNAWDVQQHGPPPNDDVGDFTKSKDAAVLSKCAAGVMIDKSAAELSIHAAGVTSACSIEVANGSILAADPCTKVDSNSLGHLKFVPWDHFKPKVAAGELKVTAGNVHYNNEISFSACDPKAKACKSIVAAGESIGAAGPMSGSLHSVGEPRLVAGSSILAKVAAPGNVDKVSLGADHARIGPLCFETSSSKPYVETHKPHVETKWASLFKPTAYAENDDVYKLDHIDLSAFREGRKLVVPEDIAAQGSCEWHNTIVGFFLGRRLPFSLVHKAASKFWENVGLVNTLATDQGTFFFQFDSAASVETVLEGGPWNVAGKPLILQQWTPSLSIEKNKVARVPIWVCFYNVPLEFWNQKGLSFIASMIGKPIQVDRMTAKRGRITYARICIEVDAKDDWITSFELEAANPSKGSTPITIRVEYQWVPERCNVCTCFGHDCNRKPPASLHSKRPVWRPSQEEKQTSTPNVDQPPTRKGEHLPRACQNDQWTTVVKKGKAKAAVVEETQIGFSKQSCLSHPPGQGLQTRILANGLIPFVYDKSVPQARENGYPSVGSPPFPSSSVTSLVNPMNNRFQVLPSEDELGAAMDQTEAAQDTFVDVDGIGDAIAHFEADQDTVAIAECVREAVEINKDKVGVAMDLVEAVEGLGTDNECDEDEEGSDEMLARGSPELGCSSSSRQRKKASKKKTSGSRPKGRHKR